MDEGDNCHPVTGSSEHYALSDKFHEANSKDKRDTLMALYHCMIRHSTVRYGSLLGGFPLGTVPGTWYFFSTTSAEVPSDPYCYQNVTCKLC